MAIFFGGYFEAASHMEIPGKCSWNPKNGGGWKMIFLCKLVISRFQLLIFQGVSEAVLFPVN